MNTNGLQSTTPEIVVPPAQQIKRRGAPFYAARRSCLTESSRSNVRIEMAEKLAALQRD